MKDKEADAIVAQVVAQLQERREELGISLNKLSELVGMDHSAILRIENGERSPLFRTVVKLAAALEVELESILP